MKKILIIQLLCLFALTGNAADRTSAQMLSLAKQKLSHIDGKSMTRSAKADVKCILEKPTLSVYGNDDEFVIISRDDRFQPVLAYGEGAFSLTDMPDGTKWWMNAIQERLANYAYSAAPAPSKVAAVSPLLTTKWGQYTPFNNYAPIFKKDNAKAPAGCIAIAMAQVMNFNQYPASAKFRNYYTISDRTDTTYVDVDRTYQWPYKNAYGKYIAEGDSTVSKGSYTPNQGNHVAYLCLDCACAVAMNYTPGGSGAHTLDVTMAMIDYFSYPINTVRYLYRDFYTEQEWMDIIYGELQQGYPFIYSGADAKGNSGHAFVADGVDGEGLLHINWGWSGQLDGYFDFRLLNPDDSEYSKGQEIVIGIRTKEFEGDKYGSMVGTEKPFILSYDNTTRKMKFEIFSISNYGGKPITGNVSILFEHQTNVEYCDTLDFLDRDETLPPYYGWGAGVEEFEWEFNPGEYKVYLASKDVHETEWQMGRALNVGAFYYNMTVDAEKNVTIAPEPVVTAVEPVLFNATDKKQNQFSNRIYDLNGRMVGNSDNTQRKGIYIINGRKVLR